MKPIAPNSLVQNRYLVVQQIGKGGMGEVYLAVDQRLGSAVALKRTRFESESELGKAFEREAKILARLRHPVLPKVIDHFIDGEDQFLVMEHISGDDLAKRLEITGKPFPMSWVMFWADQLLDALNYLHSHEPPIIHRDIKPQNLKLTDNNHIVLLDFGLSKDYESVNTGGSSGVGSIVGYSPGFAPMEQIRGTGTDARSDLYSLGATLYQLLSNKTPPDALSRADEMLGSKPDPLNGLTELNPEVAPSISEVILRSMSIRQDERFSTASEMQKTLRRAYNQSKTTVVDPKPVSSAHTVEPPLAAAAPVAAAAPAGSTTQPDPVANAMMEATLRMQPGEMETVIKQSDIRTEVFKTGDLDQNEVSHPASEALRTEPAAKGVSLETKVDPPRVQPPPPLQRRSRTGLYVGIFIALFVIGGIAAGAGWYAYNRSQAKAAPSPAATPEAINTPTVTVANTAQVDNPPTGPMDANTNQPLSNTQTSAVPNTSKTGTTASREAPSKTTQPATKASPKTKSKDERTVILQ